MVISIRTGDVVTRITKPVSIDNVGALSARSEQPIVFENIIEKPGFRLCDILVKHRPLHARALGVKREHYLRTLAYRLRLPPRGFSPVKTGPVKEVRWLGAEADLTKLPVPLQTDKDTSPYITAMNIVRDPRLAFTIPRTPGRSSTGRIGHTRASQRRIL